MQSIARNATALAIGGVVAQIVFATIEVIIARQIGNESYGVFAFVYVSVLTTALVVDMGVNWYAIDKGSRSPTDVPRLLGANISLKGVTFLAAYPILLALVYWLGYDEKTLQFLSVFYFYGVILSFQEALAATHSARRNMHINALFQGIAPIVIAIILLTLILLTSPSLSSVAWSYVLGAGAVTLIWLLRTFRIEKPNLTLRESRALIGKSYLYGASGILNQIFYKSDIILLSVLTTMPQVGVYAAGYKLLDIAYKIPVLGMRAISPPLFAAREKPDASYLDLAGLYLRLSLLGGAAIGAFCFFAAPFLILSLFGSDYHGAISILQVLSISFALKFLATCLQTLLSTMGHHRQRTTSLCVATVLLLILQYYLIGKLGAVGAAIAVVLAELVLNLSYLASIRNRSDRHKMLRATTHGAGLILVAVLTGSLLALSPLTLALIVPSVLFVLAILTGYIRLSDIALLSAKQ